MASVLAFDIETIPDVTGLRLLRGADPALSDAEVYAAEIADRAARNKSDFMPLYLQRVLVISCVFRAGKGLQVRSFVDLERDGRSEEAAVIQSFFDRIDAPPAAACQLERRRVRPAGAAAARAAPRRRRRPLLGHGRRRP